MKRYLVITPPLHDGNYVHIWPCTARNDTGAMAQAVHGWVETGKGLPYRKGRAHPYDGLVVLEVMDGAI